MGDYGEEKKNSDIKWLCFRLQRESITPPELAGELQWPAHTNLGTSSTSFFAGLLEDSAALTHCVTHYENSLLGSWIVHIRRLP